MNEDNPIRITSDDVQRVVLPDKPVQPSRDWPAEAAAGQGKSYGSIATAPRGGDEAAGVGWVFRCSWVYLGISGLLGALLGWAVCEPFVHEGQPGVNGALILMLPLVVALVCLGFALSETWVEQTYEKALERGLLSVLGGALLGAVFCFAGSLVFNLMLRILSPQSNREFSFWLGRATGWAVFGVVGGLVYGWLGRSGKKCLYGVIGGVLGAGLGGLLFDPISLGTQGGGLSRGVGFAIFGASTGVAIGLVESALKDRWLYVSGGPLAGKQFILYKTTTLIGSQQSSDIYLFKDQSILPTHAAIEIRGARAVLTAGGPALVNGQPTQERVLKSGDQIQIGRYSFDYQEKQKQS